MPSVSIVTALYNGFTGAPGYSRFHFEELTTVAACDTAGAAVRTFLSSITSWMRTDWTYSVQTTVQTFDVSTGDLVTEKGMGTPPTNVVGTGLTTTVWEGGSGTVINWLTGVILNGRKVRGRTFLVPLLSTAFSNDGTLGVTPAAQIKTAGDALVATSGVNLAVWSRQWTHPDPPAKPVQIGGNLTRCNNSQVPDRAAQLRTRRS